LFNPAMPEEYKAAVKKSWGERQLPYLEKALAGRDYLLGQFSVRCTSGSPAETLPSSGNTP